VQANDSLIGPKIKQFCKMQILADQGVIAVSPVWLHNGHSTAEVLHQVWITTHRGLRGLPDADAEEPPE